MTFTFYKYHGTGNDFVLIDDREERFPISTKTIESLCHRRFGIGADGLILLQNASGADFKMVYFNADGNQSTMCGNGGRCIVKFAHNLGLIQNRASFFAIDGIHEATVLADEIISLKMSDTGKAYDSHAALFLNTGSPHHVAKVAAVADVDVFAEGRKKRNEYGPEGANVNFVEVLNDEIFVRTYERGVENETFSCGTGVTAAALVAHQMGWVNAEKIPIRTPGGRLEVSFTPAKNGYENVWLTGPATFVFKGEIDL